MLVLLWERLLKRLALFTSRTMEWIICYLKLFSWNLTSEHSYFCTITISTFLLRFFQLPDEKKREVFPLLGDKPHGYVGIGAEKLDKLKLEDGDQVEQTFNA